MDGEELRKRYAAGEKDFTAIDLKEVNVSAIDPDLDIVVYDKLCPDFAADLSEINLSGADL
ncbi:MAG: pentapeptide repeat-containing protein, partial [Nostoc sp.]